MQGTGGGTIVGAVHPENGKLYFSPRHVCDEIGLSWPRQFKKIKEDAVFRTSVAVMATQLSGTSQSREYLMLPAELLSGWLTTIRKTSDPRKQLALTRYRREAYAVLDAWRTASCTSRRAMCV